MKTKRLPGILIGVILLSSCTKTELPPDELDESGNICIDVGSYFLLDSSISQLPYLGEIGVDFIDSLDNHLELEIIESETFFPQTPGRLFRYDVFEEGDTVEYKYLSESKSFSLRNDSVDIRINLTLKARPYYPSPDSLYVADVLEALWIEPDSIVFGRQIFYHLTNQRTWPISSGADSIGTVEIYGKTFPEVWQNDFSNPKSLVRFNYMEGIISFTDEEGKTWRFEKFIE